MGALFLAAPVAEVPVVGAVKQADEDDGHVVAAEAAHLTVGRQAPCHQFLADLKTTSCLTRCQKVSGRIHRPA